MDTLKSDCLYEDKVSDHIDLLVRQVVDTSIALNRIIIIATFIISASIILAAFISRPYGARYRSIGTNKIFDAQTGEVKWADPPEDKE